MPEFQTRTGSLRETRGPARAASASVRSDAGARKICPTLQRALWLSEDALAAYRDRKTPDRQDHDAAPVVLAALHLGLDPAQRPLAEATLDRWLAELPEDFGGIGPFGGLGGFIAGLRAALMISEGVAPLYRAVCAKTPEWLAQIEWRSSQVAWRDYDYFTGPSGVILAGAAPDCPERMFDPALSHLTAMCDSPALDAFRAGDEIDDRSDFNIGRINTGLGHGLAGVASALHHACRVLDAGQTCRPALEKLSHWLLDEVITDSRDLITWPPVGSDGGPRPEGFVARQAWCYGTPGVAWTLWDISQTLGDPTIAALSREAMRSFCEVFDARIYIDDAPADESLTICHGAAGTLAVADAFHRHAGIDEAGVLRDQLTEYLLDRPDQLRTLSGADMSMLSGAGGALAVLLTTLGADRRWLHQIALR